MTIHAYRSIEDAELSACGDLNVLIGKNNAGKSNLLSAIQAFFAFFSSDGSVATLHPPLKEPTDWYSRSEDSPVTITATLDLDPIESKQIHDAVSEEVPQMRNALDDIYQLSPTYALECELVFKGSPKTLGYVGKLAFTLPQSHTQNRILFGLEEAAAIEIASREEEIKGLTSAANVLTRFSNDIDVEDLRVFQDQRTASGRAIISRRLASYPELSSVVNRLVRETDSVSDFQEKAAAHADLLRTQATDLRETPNANRVTTFSGAAETVPQYVIRIVKLISSLKVHYLPEQRQPIGEKEARRILNLKMSRGQSGVLKELQDTVAELLGVQIDAFTSERPLRTPQTINAELDVDDFLIQVNGSGIREALRLVLDYEFERPDVLLVEEPEVHLHPALETAMMQYLRKISSKCQIFLTTHSTNFLDIADLRNVYLVTRAESTNVQLLNAEEAEEAIPQELGIRLSSLFLYDRLVFVEGPSDEQILRIFASTLGVNLSQAGIGFISTGGARNFTHYANASTLSFLSKRRVVLHFVLDHDERDLPEIDRLEGMLDGLGQLHILGKRELENYLVVPHALARYINSKAGRRVVEDSSEILRLIEEASSELLETAVERRVLRVACMPVVPNRSAVIDRGEIDFLDALEVQLDQAVSALSEMRSGILELLSKSREALTGLSTEDRVSVVPGDCLIDSVFQKFGLRFNKRKDGPRIAAIMTADEIPSEMKQLLYELVSAPALTMGAVVK